MQKEECNSRIALKRKLVRLLYSYGEWNTFSGGGGRWGGGGGGGGQLSIQFQVKQLANGSQLLKDKTTRPETVSFL